MEKDSALYQLMDTRMNGIVSSDGEYQAFSHKSDIAQSCAIVPGLGCSPTCLAFPTARPCFWGNACRLIGISQ
ncbi:hypothetical protein [Parablautia intestinalis]|nr:hypothetical protein [Parablautia intestinalis]